MCRNGTQAISHGWEILCLTCEAGKRSIEVRETSGWRHLDCEWCPAHQLQWQSGMSSCVDCNKGINCQSSQSQIIVNERYWRPSTHVNGSDGSEDPPFGTSGLRLVRHLGIVLSGPDSNLNATVGRCPFSTCKGGNLSGDALCHLRNAAGPWCGQCKAGHFLDESSLKSSCRKCQARWYIYLMLCLLGLCVLIGLYFADAYLTNGLQSLVNAKAHEAKKSQHARQTRGGCGGGEALLDPPSDRSSDRRTTNSSILSLRSFSRRSSFASAPSTPHRKPGGGSGSGGGGGGGQGRSGAARGRLEPLTDEESPHERKRGSTYDVDSVLRAKGCTLREVTLAMLPSGLVSKGRGGKAGNTRGGIGGSAAGGGGARRKKRRGEAIPVALRQEKTNLARLAAAEEAEMEDKLEAQHATRTFRRERVHAKGFRGWAWRMWAQRPPSFAADAAAIAKVLVGYVQVMHELSSFYLVDWPPVFEQFLRVLRIQISIDVFVAPACVLKRPLRLSERLFADLSTPLILLVLLLLTSLGPLWKPALARKVRSLCGAPAAPLTPGAAGRNRDADEDEEDGVGGGGGSSRGSAFGGSSGRSEARLALAASYRFRSDAADAVGAAVDGRACCANFGGSVDTSTLTWVDLVTAPRVCNLVGWLLLFAYPTLCKITLASFACQLPFGVGDKRHYFLRQDTNVACFTSEWTPLLLMSSFSLIVYIFGTPLAAYRLTRDYSRRLHASSTRAFVRVGSIHRQRVSLLVQSYKDHSWWFESVDLLRKFLLTGVVSLFFPNDRRQLWFGLLVASISAIVYIRREPYRGKICGHVQAAAQLSILFGYTNAIIFFSDDETNRGLGSAAEQPFNASSLAHNETLLASSRPFSPPAAPPPLGLVTNHGEDWRRSLAIGVSLIVLSSTALILLIVMILVVANTQRKQLNELELQHEGGHGHRLGEPVIFLEPIYQDGYHVFLSHVWKYAQDSCGRIKSTLRLMCPTMLTFLDVDNLKSVAKLEDYVRRSELIVILLTSTYIRSHNCRRELKEAYEQCKRIVILREMDEDHGAILDPEDLRNELNFVRQKASDDQREDDEGFAAEMKACEWLIECVETGDVLEWHREAHLRNAVLKRIAQEAYAAHEAEIERIEADRQKHATALVVYTEDGSESEKGSVWSGRSASSKRGGAGSNKAGSQRASQRSSQRASQRSSQRSSRLRAASSARSSVASSDADGDEPKYDDFPMRLALEVNQKKQLKARAGGKLFLSNAYTFLPASSADFEGQTMYKELEAHFKELEVTLAFSDTMESTQDADRIPSLLVLTPHVVSNDHLLKDAMKTCLRGGEHISAALLVPLYSTAMPLKNYAEELHSVRDPKGHAAALAELPYSKWPLSSDLQAVAAEHAVLTHVRPPKRGACESFLLTNMPTLCTSVVGCVRCLFTRRPNHHEEHHTLHEEAPSDVHSIEEDDFGVGGGSGGIGGIGGGLRAKATSAKQASAKLASAKGGSTKLASAKDFVLPTSMRERLLGGRCTSVKEVVSSRAAFATEVGRADGGGSDGSEEEDDDETLLTASGDAALGETVAVRDMSRRASQLESPLPDDPYGYLSAAEAAKAAAIQAAATRAGGGAAAQVPPPLRAGSSLEAETLAGKLAGKKLRLGLTAAASAELRPRRRGFARLDTVMAPGTVRELALKYGSLKDRSATKRGKEERADERRPLLATSNHPAEPTMRDAQQKQAPRPPPAPPAPKPAGLSPPSSRANAGLFVSHASWPGHMPPFVSYGSFPAAKQVPATGGAALPPVPPTPPALPPNAAVVVVAAVVPTPPSQPLFVSHAKGWSPASPFVSYGAWMAGGSFGATPAAVAAAPATRKRRVTLMAPGEEQPEAPGAVSAGGASGGAAGGATGGVAGGTAGGAAGSAVGGAAGGASGAPPMLATNRKGRSYTLARAYSKNDVLAIGRERAPTLVASRENEEDEDEDEDEGENTAAVRSERAQSKPSPGVVLARARAFSSQQKLLPQGGGGGGPSANEGPAARCVDVPAAVPAVPAAVPAAVPSAVPAAAASTVVASPPPKPAPGRAYFLARAFSSGELPTPAETAHEAGGQDKGGRVAEDDADQGDAAPAP